MVQPRRSAARGPQRARLGLALALTLALAGGCDAERGHHSTPNTAIRAESVPPATQTATLAAAAPDELAAIVRYTAGARAEQKLPLLVVLHGLGDKPDHFVQVYADLPIPTRVVAAQAFTRYHGGYSWFPVDLSGARAIAYAADVKASADRLARWLETLSSRYPTVGKPIVSGFSQGGMLTFALTAYHPGAIGAAFPIGGALDPRELPSVAPAQAPVLMAFHGEQDPLVRYAPTAELISTMAARGYRAEMHSYPDLGHGISAALRADLYDALAGAIKPTPPR